MKILHMHFGKEGGAERFFVILAKALAERGVEQRFVIRPDRLWRGEVAPLGPLIEDNYRNLSISKYVTKWRVNRMVRDWKPDVIMAWMTRSSKLMPDYPDALRLTRLGDYPRSLKDYQRNDLMVVNAPDMGRALRDLGWERPIEVVSNFPREITPVPTPRAEHDTPEDAFLVVGTGRFIRRKGFDTLLRAVAKVDGAWLWLAGDGDQREALEALAGELGIAERTRFLGWVPEAMHTVAAGDIYVMPSRHEPLGNVVLEAWAAGTSPVVTRSEGPQWFVEDGHDALMVEIDDVDAMATSIARLRDDRALGARLVEAGRAKIAERFTKEKIVDAYMEVFRGERP